MKVSIITVVYNNKQFIAECLESVKSQTYSDIEHIVIDGGSTDGTQTIIESYKNNLAYYKSEKDEGLYDGLNKGIQQATGDVVGILHSDDLFYNNDVIQDVVDSFNKSDADIVYGEGVFVERGNINKVKRYYGGKEFKKNNLLFGWVPLHTTIYVKRELFLNMGLYRKDFLIAGDYEITLRWLTNTDIKTYYLKQLMVKMRLGGKSTTAGLQKKKSGEDLKILREYGFPGIFTLFCKIGRKVPQYILPHLITNKLLKNK